MGEIGEQVRVLVEHLVHFSGYPGVSDWTAKGIIGDPQAHIDALVAAGVLKVGFTRDSYHVVQLEPPHVHDWRVRGYFTTGVDLRCECGETRRVPNRLPIEVPS